MGRVATYTLPHGGFPMLHSGRQNQKWAKGGPGGYITPAAWEIPNASKRQTKSEVAHKLRGWLHNPCHLWGPNTKERGTKSAVAHKWAARLDNTHITPAA